MKIQIKKLLKFTLVLIIMPVLSIGLIKAESSGKVFVALGHNWQSPCVSSIYFISLDEKDVHYCPGYSFVGDLGIAHYNQHLRLVAFTDRDYSQDFYAVFGAEVLITVYCDDFENTAEVFARVHGAHHIASIGTEESVCLSENESYNLTIEIIEPHPNAEGFLEITPKDNSAEKVIIDLPNQPFLYNIDLYDIIVNNDWWDTDLNITAKTRLKFTECEIIDTTYVRIFSKQIPPATVESVLRTACDTTKIIIDADLSVATNLGSYDFTLSPSDPNSSNIYTLTPRKDTGSNRIILLDEESYIPPESANYVLQIAYKPGPNPETDPPCAFTTPVNVPAKPADFEFGTINTFNLDCFGDNSGKISAGVLGGRGPYSISPDGIDWFPGTELTNLPAGDHTIYVRDADNCMIHRDATLSEPPQLIVYIDESINPQCFGDATGEIHVSTTGGTGPYQISKDLINWTADTILVNLTAGDYTVYVLDSMGCTTTTAASITQPDDISVVHTPNSPTCYGSNDGSISLIVTGGSGDYQYLWDTGATTSNIANLLKGNYQVRITDSKDCMKEAAFDLTEPEVISVDINPTGPTCHDSADGSLLATASGGPSMTGPYDYLWSTGATSQQLNELGQGNYAVEVTDDLGCKGTESIFLEAPPPPSPGWGTNSAVLCEGNTITLDGGDFVSYLWYTSAGTLSNQRYLTVSLAGTYFLDITDDKGCKGTDSFVITLLESPIEAELLLADSARVNEIISVIDVTWPVPDSLEWFFDKPVVLHMQNDWSAHFSSAEEGLIAVTLRAWYAGCYSDSAKTVMIIDDGKVIEINTRGNERLIRGFYLFPNPNSGYFNVDVKLRERTDISLSVYRASTSIAVYTDRFYGEEQYLIPVSLPGLRSGVYVVIVQAGNEREVLRMVIQ